MLNTPARQVAGQLLRDKGLIDGRWVDADDGRTLPVHNPANDERIGAVPLMGAEETRRAIAAANAAFPAWSGKLAKERADILLNWCRLMLERADQLAHLLTLEQGKPLAEARGEIAYAASFLRFYAEEARRVYGEIIPQPRPDLRIMVLKQPIGVVACITPWNFPAAMITRKAAPALAAGCTVVMKPAEATPLSALAIAALADEAGVPAGVLNVVTGEPAPIGSELCANPMVRKMSFTGSTATGRLLAAQCAPTIKNMGLELGGNAPFIVVEDADLKAAVDGAVLSKFRHSGQTCVCTNRFLVHAGIYDAFAEQFTKRVMALKVGNGFGPGVDVGPLINARAVAKVEAHVADAVARGATLLAGGKRHAAGANFFEPTVLSGVTADMRAACEETFGPMAALMRFETEDEVIALANGTEYGLAGYFYTQNMARAWRVAEKLESGMVGVNSGFLSVEVAPFGGVKQSGIGREGSHQGLEGFLEIKYLSLGV